MSGAEIVDCPMVRTHLARYLTDQLNLVLGASFTHFHDYFSKLVLCFTFAVSHSTDILGVTDLLE